MVWIRHPSQAEFHLEFLGLRSVPIKDVDVTADLSSVDSVPLAIIIVWVPSGSEPPHSEFPPGGLPPGGSLLGVLPGGPPLEFLFPKALGAGQVLSVLVVFP